ncbi:MAG TPA: efflux RND transporter periplasmic adaptor subunit [Gemmatimonadales bacterium]|nr:efflux RND transporter periplasmic adaptor subunit [Gemmatimonadales bacterium]
MTTAASLRSTAAALLLLTGCKKAEPPVVYQALPVERRDIVVSVQASGTVQPDTVVEVKSKASGEILDLKVETGQAVKRGQLMVLVDPRNPRNTLAQAEADLEVAQARLTNATSQQRRADELFKSQSITEQEHESALLDYANAKAEVVRARVAVDNARDQLDDTRVLAPINGTIIEKSVERGQVISSPTRDVGGGTVLLKMADLNLVQVRTLVDETDIGKIQVGQLATVTVDAYPARPFQGSVLKIEPQAQTEQNVTMFPVLVRIDNRQGLLRPGMNAEVEVHVGERREVLAVPNAALRTQRDVASAAQVLGLDPAAVQKALAARTTDRRATDGTASLGGAAGDTARSGGGGTMTLRDGRTVALPTGVTEEQIRAALAKRRGGQQLSTKETAILEQVQRASGGSGAGGTTRQSGGADNLYGGRYIVFVKRPAGPEPAWIRTGLTDLDYSEVREGLTASDSVLVLPSASLVQSQQEAQERINRMTGGGGLPGMRQQGGAAAEGGTRVEIQRGAPPTGNR